MPKQSSRKHNTKHSNTAFANSKERDENSRNYWHLEGDNVSHTGVLKVYHDYILKETDKNEAFN